MDTQNIHVFCVCGTLEQRKSTGKGRIGHTEIKDWRKNVISAAIVPRGKIIFPPLHIKLELMKQFVKALNKEGKCCEYVRSLPKVLGTLI